MLFFFPQLGAALVVRSFNGHPPLEVNAIGVGARDSECGRFWFQWAPTLGGECYMACYIREYNGFNKFQWAPTLGGECYGTLQTNTDG